MTTHCANAATPIQKSLRSALVRLWLCCQEVRPVQRNMLMQKSCRLCLPESFLFIFESVLSSSSSWSAVRHVDWHSVLVSATGKWAVWRNKHTHTTLYVSERTIGRTGELERNNRIGHRRKANNCWRIRVATPTHTHRHRERDSFEPTTTPTTQQKVIH